MDSRFAVHESKRVRYLMLHIDGSQGEGGGQIVRSALTLSVVTGVPITLSKIRAGRKKPGLLRQHLTAVRAAEEISQARVTGNGLGSTRLTFEPQAVRAGEFVFDIGTAGSATLVAQTVLPALLTASGPSLLTVRGGTHNPLAPPFEFFSRVYLPLLNRLGPRASATLARHGFYPAGGGEFSVSVMPPETWSGYELLNRGELREKRVTAVVSQLPQSIAVRELNEIARLSGWDRDSFEVEVARSPGPGNIVLIELRFEHVTEIFSACGERGVPAEKVAANAWREAQLFLDSTAPVGPHLADQLLLPLGLAAHSGHTSTFRTLPLTMHSQTHRDVLRAFLPLDIQTEEHDDGTLIVTVRGCANR